MIFLNSKVLIKLLPLFQFQSRITSDGYLFITSDKTRSKQLNIANCMEKLRDIIWKAEGPEVVELSEEDKILQLKRYALKKICSKIYFNLTFKCIFIWNILYCTD